jgi:hypothetical protein
MLMEEMLDVKEKERGRGSVKMHGLDLYACMSYCGVRV